MIRFLKVFLTLCLFLLFPNYCYATTFNDLLSAILGITVSVGDVIYTLLTAVISIGLTLASMFYAGRILKQLKILFPPPPPPCQ